MNESTRARPINRKGVPFHFPDFKEKGLCVTKNNECEDVGHPTFSCCLQYYGKGRISFIMNLKSWDEPVFVIE